MKSPASESGTKTAQVSLHAPTFSKVLDGRKQPVRGLWRRGERFYAQLTIEESGTGKKSVRRVPIKDKEGNPVSTVPQAIAELNRLKTQRTDNTLPVLRRTPRFGDYADRYLEFIRSGQGTKARNTISKESCNLVLWKEHFGDLRVDQIKRSHVNAFIEARLKAGMAPRTVNLDVITLRNVLKRAVDDQWIQDLPTRGMKPLRISTPKRPFYPVAEIERLCSAAESKNAVEFRDYVRFLTFSGSRMNEALRVRWQDVDFDRQQVTIGAEGDTKNRTARTVDFNPNLAELLENMAGRRAPDSQWLFPSPQRGEKDIHAATFRESLSMAKAKAEMQAFGFHDCRHTFISMCVMAGVDFMTIAAWVGHRDGGVLIGKVYGHLADAHKRAQAARVSFTPTITNEQAREAL